MDEKRLQKYFDIINELIANAGSEQEEIPLDTDPEYIDAGLVQTMIEVAQGFSEEGHEDAADFLVSIATPFPHSFPFSLSAFLAVPPA